MLKIQIAKIGHIKMSKYILLKTELKRFFHIKLSYHERYEYLVWKFGNTHFSVPKEDYNDY